MTPVSQYFHDRDLVAPAMDIAVARSMMDLQARLKRSERFAHQLLLTGILLSPFTVIGFWAAIVLLWGTK